MSRIFGRIGVFLVVMLILPDDTNSKEHSSACDSASDSGETPIYPTPTDPLPTTTEQVPSYPETASTTVPEPTQPETTPTEPGPTTTELLPSDPETASTTAPKPTQPETTPTEPGPTSPNPPPNTSVPGDGERPNSKECSSASEEDDTEPPPPPTSETTSALTPGPAPSTLPDMTTQMQPTTPSPPPPQPPHPSTSPDSSIDSGECTSESDEGGSKPTPSIPTSGPTTAQSIGPTSPPTTTTAVTPSTPPTTTPEIGPTSPPTTTTAVTPSTSPTTTPEVGPTTPSITTSSGGSSMQTIIPTNEPVSTPSTPFPPGTLYPRPKSKECASDSQEGLAIGNPEPPQPTALPSAANVPGVSNDLARFCPTKECTENADCESCYCHTSHRLCF